MKNGQSASKQPIIKVEGSEVILCCEGVEIKLYKFNPEMVEANFIFVYVLCEPNSYNIRYVGVSKNPTKRYYNHINDFRLDERNHKLNWILKLKKQKLKPEMFIIDKISIDKDVSKIEEDYIKILQKYFKLTNLYGIKNDNINYNYSRVYCYSKKVYKFDMFGKLLNEYSSLVEAALLNNINQSNNISTAIKKQKKCKGFLWSFEPEINFIYENNKGLHCSKNCFCYDLNNNLLFEFKTINEASRILNIKSPNVRNSLKRGHICNKKYKFYYNKIC